MPLSTKLGLFDMLVTSVAGGGGEGARGTLNGQ